MAAEAVAAVIVEAGKPPNSRGADRAGARPMGSYARCISLLRTR